MGIKACHKLLQDAVKRLSYTKSPEFIKLQSEVVNKSLHNIPITHEEMKSLVSASVGSGWSRLHPESLNIPANITTLQQLKPGLSPEIANDQNLGKYWEDNPLEWCLR